MMYALLLSLFFLFPVYCGQHSSARCNSKVAHLFVQQDSVNFVDDGIRIEPFNLEQEREEGYFDENGNFVEYARGNELKVLPISCWPP